MPRLFSTSPVLCCLAAALLISTQCGCEPAPLGDPTVGQTGSGAAHEEPIPHSHKSIPIANVKLEIVDGDGYQAALARHKGNVVLVDFWATWCEPCIENFPHIVELHNQHEAEDLRVIGFACNELNEEATVRQFLAENGAAFDNLLTKFGNGTQTNETFDIHGVPYYKLYDRQGELRYQFAYGHEDLEHGEPVENIDQRVAELLAESL